MSPVVKRACLAITLILATAAAGWIYSSFERVPVETESGFRGEARRDPLLALRRLFASLGAPLRTFSHRRGLPPIDATLVFLDGPRSRPSGQSREVLDWVARGGHAVVVARGKDDPLLAPFDVTSRRADVSRVTVPVSWQAGERLEVEFTSTRELEPGGTEPIARAGGHAMVFRLGAGRVTALSGDAFLTNAKIGRADNAAFLWRLTHLARAGETWIITGGGMQPLWLQLLGQGWPLAVSLAALLLAGGWAASQRFGPVIPEATRLPPRLLGHISASGAFYWRHGTRAILLDAVRDSVLRTINYRRPGWLAAGDRDERIASLTGLPASQVEKAFTLHEPADRRSFTDVVRTLETIRKRL